MWWEWYELCSDIFWTESVVNWKWGWLCQFHFHFQVIVGIFGIFGNSFSILVLSSSQMRNTFNQLLVNLTILSLTLKSPILQFWFKSVETYLLFTVVCNRFCCRSLFYVNNQVVLALLDNAFLVLSILNNSLASVLHWPFSKTSEMWVSDYF